MKTSILLGTIFVVIGVISFAYHGFTYTTRERVMDIGSLHMTAEKTNTFFLPPIVGASSLVVGIVFLSMGSRKTD